MSREPDQHDGARTPNPPPASASLDAASDAENVRAAPACEFVATLFDDSHAQRLRVTIHREPRHLVTDMPDNAELTCTVVVELIDAAPATLDNDDDDLSATSGNATPNELHECAEAWRPMLMTAAVTVTAGRLQTFTRQTQGLVLGQTTQALLIARHEEFRLRLVREYGIPQIHVELSCDGTAYLPRSPEVPGHAVFSLSFWTPLSAMRVFCLDLCHAIGLTTAPGADLDKLSPAPPRIDVARSTAGSAPASDATEPTPAAASATTPETADVATAAAETSAPSSESTRRRYPKRRDPSTFITIDTAVFPRRLVDAILDTPTGSGATIPVEDVDDERWFDPDDEDNQSLGRGEDRNIDEDGFLINEDEDDADADGFLTDPIDDNAEATAGAPTNGAATTSSAAAGKIGGDSVATTKKSDAQPSDGPADETPAPAPARGFLPALLRLFRPAPPPSPAPTTEAASKATAAESARPTTAGATNQATSPGTTEPADTAPASKSLTAATATPAPAPADARPTAVHAETREDSAVSASTEAQPNAFHLSPHSTAPAEPTDAGSTDNDNGTDRPDLASTTTSAAPTASTAAAPAPSTPSQPTAAADADAAVPPAHDSAR